MGENLAETFNDVFMFGFHHRRGGLLFRKNIVKIVTGRVVRQSNAVCPALDTE